MDQADMHRELPSGLGSDQPFDWVWDRNARKLAQEFVHLGFWESDAVARQVYWSYGMERMHGLPQGGFGGSIEAYDRLIHPSDLARIQQERLAAIESRQPFEMVHRIIRPDAAVRWVKVLGATHWADDATLLGGSGIQIDITEQMARDQHLQLQAQVIATMAEGVIMVHAETGRIVHANPRFAQMLGYAIEALLGLPIAAINARSDQDPQAVADQILAELCQDGQWRGEVHNLCADGREIWTACTVSEFVHEDLGRIWVSVHTDITERRTAQQARDEALTQLRRLSLNIQESIEAERLAVSREVHDQLGASLTGIHMKLEALAAALPPGATALAQSLQDVAQSARDTQRAARDICTRMRPPLLDDVGLLEACRWYLADWSDSVGIAVQDQFAELQSEPDGMVATDMFRVMQELLTNVARHAQASRVEVSLLGDGARLQLRVQDDGQGFDTGDTTMGFGLMGARERVRHHAGTLQIDSGVSGTTVSVVMHNLTAP